MTGADAGTAADARRGQRWDVALSFAGAQRDYVEQVAEALKARGPGYHHVMLREDYDVARARLEAAGHAVALESVTPFGERCALFDTTAVNGGFVTTAI